VITSRSSSAPNETLTNHGFFNPAQPQDRAIRLFKLVKAANYRKVEETVSSEPTLMFMPVCCTYPDGKIESISPLQYAFKVRDTYMWKMLWNIVRDNTLHSGQFLKQKSPGNYARAY
jgi:hypothetical protein